MRGPAFVMLFVCTVALATTYRWVDANGVVHYSDTPGPGAKQIELPSAQTYSAPPAPSAPAAKPGPASGRPAAAYQSCAITSPASEQTLFAVEAVTVTAALQPAKRASDTVTFNFDGMTVQPLSPDGLELRLSPVDRGTHTVSVTVRDSNGNTVCTSASVTFYVRQPSVLAPQSPLKPK
jgi:hypothetical protein